MIGVRYVDDKSTCVDRENTAVLREKIHSQGELSPQSSGGIDVVRGGEDE